VDIAVVLARLKDGFIESLMDTPIFQKVFITRVKEIMKRLQEEHFGIRFGMFLHFELRMTMANILRLTQAANKIYNRERDRYDPKVLFFDRYEGYAGRRVLVPRVAPPRGKLEKVIRSIEGTLNVQIAEDGRLSFVLLQELLKDLLLKDLGKLGAPPLVEFLDGKRSLYLAISFDATGFAAAQLTTVAIRNSWLPRSSQHLRVFGLGNCGDDRDGMVQLLGPNLAFINEIFHAKRVGRLVSISLDDNRVVKLDIDKGRAGRGSAPALRAYAERGLVLLPAGAGAVDDPEEAGDSGRDDRAFAHLREPDFREALPFVAQPAPRAASA
jgi:hypothetical protein